jgi:hypothetical protein
MRATIVYGIAFASAIVFSLLWRLSQFLTVKARERIFSIITKWMVFTVPFPRIDGTSDVTILSATFIVILFAGNIVASLIAVRDHQDFSFRLARLSLTNMIFLYVGGRTNLFVDKIFRLSHTEYWLLHRWLGRVATLEGMVHGALEVARSRSFPSALRISVCSNLLPSDKTWPRSLTIISSLPPYPHLYYYRSSAYDARSMSFSCKLTSRFQLLYWYWCGCISASSMRFCYLA